MRLASLPGSPPRAWGIRPHLAIWDRGPSGSPPRAWGILRCVCHRLRWCGSPPRAWGIRKPCPRLDTRQPVHPHARGEYGCGDAYVVAPGGSPPRAWGIPTQAAREHLAGGSPPRAWGIRIPECNETAKYSVHPHARGEYALTGAGTMPVCGSPPRAWGIRSELSGPRLARSVHPHARGEYELSSACFIISSGSPPRAWGILVRALRTPQRQRFTPTRVGNTHSKNR